MSRLCGCFIRRAAGLVGLLVAVALIAAPAALAQGGTTITAAATVQFNGVIDASPKCTDPTGITINWGDGSRTSGGTKLSDGEVLGTHSYATAGSYTGSITFTGPSDCTTGPADAFTATVGATPTFTQCPQVGDDTGCQFLIDVTPNGVNVLQDANQGPYEGSEDALIGIKNDSSSPVSSIPISTPGSDTFSFDGDGICDANTEVGNDAPFPAGCQQISPVGSCDPTSGNPCAYAPAPGESAPDPDNYTGSNQNGYEGPQTYFTNVATTLDSGTVVFSPALQPGQSTYFSLEEPPSASAINVGSTPVGPAFTGAPTVTATGASFSGVVDPNGSATTASFQYGLDLKYSKPGQSGPSYTNSTPAQAVGGDFADHSVTATVTGLVPNALYHARLVATNKNGSSFGPDITFSTSHGATPGSPKLGQNFNISLVSGLVLVKVHGVFIPLTELTQIPKNTEIDALNGSLSLITALPAGSHPTADIRQEGQGQEGQGQDGHPEGHLRRRDLQDHPGRRRTQQGPRHALDCREGVQGRSELRALHKGQEGRRRIGGCLEQGAPTPARQRQGQVPHQRQVRRGHGPRHEVDGRGPLRRHASPTTSPTRCQLPTSSSTRRSSSTPDRAIWPRSRRQGG